MNSDLSNFLIQSAATVIGGMILFLLGLLYSAISKKSKEYTNWLTKNWRLLIGILLLIYVTFNVYAITKNIYFASIPIVFSIMVFLFIFQINKSNELKSAKLNELQINALLELKADILFERILYWQEQKVYRNVIDYCSEALRYAPPSYDDFIAILDIVEKTIHTMNSEKEILSTYEFSRLHQALSNVPIQYAPLVDRIKSLLDHANKTK